MTNLQTVRTVLVVDDDQSLCDLLAETLIEAGYAVRCAHDGEAAWLAIQSQSPDLILSDIIMPRIGWHQPGSAPGRDRIVHPHHPDEQYRSCGA